MKKGWFNPNYLSAATKFHYDPGCGRSLCGKWGTPFLKEDQFEEGKDDHPDNCKECVRRKKALDAQQAQQTQQTKHPQAEDRPQATA